MEPFLPYIGYLLVAVLLCSYIVISSIEFGSALILLMPSTFKTERRLVSRYFNPAWEATNVLLVFAVVAIITAFPKAIVPITTSLLLLIDVAIVFFGTRILGVLLLFYGEIDALVSRIIFFIGSFGAPLVLSCGYFFFLTGSASFWPTPFLVGIWAMVVAVIILISSSFFLFFGKLGNPGEADIKRLALIGSVIFLLAGALTLYGGVTEAPHLTRLLALPATSGILMLLPAFLFPYFLHHRKFGTAFIVSIVATLGFVVPLALAHLPYLVYPSITIQSAFTVPSVYMAALISLIFGALITIPSFVLLYRMFASPRSVNAP